MLYYLLLLTKTKINQQLLQNKKNFRYLQNNKKMKTKIFNDRLQQLKIMKNIKIN